jgi:hypothetical protein
LSYLAFDQRDVPDTTSLVANLADFITQLSGPETGPILVGLPAAETFVDTRAVNNSKRFGNIFSEQERARLNKFNHEIYAAYVIRQAQCRNAVWDLFLQQAITFQCERIVLQIGDTVSHKFTDLPWWFTLVLYSQACLAADVDFLTGESLVSAREVMHSQLVLFADYVLERVNHLVCNHETAASASDLIVMHQLLQVWSSRITDLQQRLINCQQERGKMRDKRLFDGALSMESLEKRLTAQVENLRQGYARLLTVSPLTYFSTRFHSGAQPPVTLEVQRQLLENIVRLDQSDGLQRWMAGEVAKICYADSGTLGAVGKLFMAVCDWARKAPVDYSYLGYQWRIFLLYCYELFAVEHSLNKKSCFQKLPPDCVGIADAFIQLRGAFYEADGDPNRDGAKRLFHKEYGWYQEQEVSARLLDVFYEARGRAIST